MSNLSLVLNDPLAVDEAYACPGLKSDHSLRIYIQSNKFWLIQYQSHIYLKIYYLKLRLKLQFICI